MAAMGPADACIETIVDEDLLRQMWKEADEGDAKKQIRLRMYKLREQRLKEFYNREGILENILKTGVDEPFCDNAKLEQTPPAPVVTQRVETQQSEFGTLKSGKTRKDNKTQPRDLGDTSGLSSPKATSGLTDNPRLRSRKTTPESSDTLSLRSRKTTPESSDTPRLRPRKTTSESSDTPRLRPRKTTSESSDTPALRHQKTFSDSHDSARPGPRKASSDQNGTLRIRDRKSSDKSQTTRPKIQETLLLKPNRTNQRQNENNLNLANIQSIPKLSFIQSLSPPPPLPPPKPKRKGIISPIPSINGSPKMSTPKIKVTNSKLIVHQSEPKRQGSPINQSGDRKILSTKATPRFMAPTKSRENAATANPNIKPENKSSRTQRPVTTATAPVSSSSIRKPRERSQAPASTQPKKSVKPQQSAVSTQLLSLSTDREKTTHVLPALRVISSRPIIHSSTKDAKGRESPSQLATDIFDIHSLDLLDSYLEQLSPTQDSNDPFQVIPDPIPTFSSTIDKKASGGHKKVIENRRDVQETGEEPIVTRSVYKYLCDDTETEGKNGSLARPRSHIPLISGSGSKDVDKQDKNQKRKKSEDKVHTLQKSEGKSQKPKKSEDKDKPRKGSLDKIQKTKKSEYKKQKRENDEHKIETVETEDKILATKISKFGFDALSKPRKTDHEKSPTIQKGKDKSSRQKSCSSSGSSSGSEEDDLDVTSKKLNRDSRIKSSGMVRKAKEIFEQKASQEGVSKPHAQFHSFTCVEKVRKNTAKFEAKARGQEPPGSDSAVSTDFEVFESSGSRRGSEAFDKRFSLVHPIPSLVDLVPLIRPPEPSEPIGTLIPAPPPNTTYRFKSEERQLKTQLKMDSKSFENTDFKQIPEGPKSQLKSARRETTPIASADMAPPTSSRLLTQSKRPSSPTRLSRISPTRSEVASKVKVSTVEDFLLADKSESDDLKIYDKGQSSGSDDKSRSTSGFSGSGTIEKPWVGRIWKPDPNNFVVSTVVVPVVPFTVRADELSKNYQMITSPYGSGPTDDNGKTLFGLSALRRVKELELRENQATLLDSNENLIEAVNAAEPEETESFPMHSNISANNDSRTKNGIISPIQTAPRKDPLQRAFSSQQNGSSGTVGRKSREQEFDHKGMNNLHIAHSLPAVNGASEQEYTGQSWKRTSADQLPSKSGAIAEPPSKVDDIWKQFETKSGGNTEQVSAREEPNETNDGAVHKVTETDEIDPNGTGVENDLMEVYEPNGTSVENELMEVYEPILPESAVDDEVSECFGDINPQNEGNELADSELGKDDENETLGQIESQLENLGVSAGASKTVSKTATRSADVTGELMPFILGQLQASLESIGASGGGSLLRRQSQSDPPGSQITSSPPHSSPSSSTANQIESSNAPPHPNSTSSRNTSPSKSEVPSVEEVVSTPAPPEECLFDSGTESGEDVGGHDPPPVQTKSSQSPPAEFSSFMDGLRDTLSREGLAKGVLKSGDKSGTPRDSTAVVPESDLIQQVEKVLTLLRDSLVQDVSSSGQNLKEGLMTPDLIALIDRLKVSLQRSPEAKPKGLPSIVGSPSPPKEPHPPPDLTVRKLPWVDSGVCTDGEEPWKVRAAKKRGIIRSKSIGVSDEELEEARRHLQEEAFRSALRDEPVPSDVSKRLKSPGTAHAQVVSRGLSSHDDSSLQNPKFKPSRTISLGNPIELVDPSRSFFTPAEAIQIAIHKAAIQKQVSAEEDRRRSSSGSILPATTIFAPKQLTAVKRDFTLALPKPYVAPSSSSSDEGHPGQRSQSGHGQLLLSNKSSTPRSIENVQISLKESGDMPQLQIAITLNTNTNESQSNKNRSDGDVRGQNEEHRGQGEGSSDESSKSYRYRSKSERKKKMKRANTIDVLPPSDVDLEDEGERSDDECRLKEAPPVQSTPTIGINRGMFLDKLKDPPSKPAFLTAGDNYWNNRFSTLKTSFESSSQGSSPSISPIPAPYARSPQAPAHVQMNFNPAKEQILQSPTKPVWAAGATSAPSGQTNSSVKNKLSVFEGRGQTPVPSGIQKISDSWKPSSSISPVIPNRNSAIFQKRESIERKLAEECAALSQPFKRIGQREYGPEGEGTSTHASASEPINEGVHTVHATKSALEAMQRQIQTQPPPIPPRNINQTHQFPPPHHSLLDREATPPWQKVSQPMTQFVNKFNQFNNPPQPPFIPPKSNIALKKPEFENPRTHEFGANLRHPSLVKQRTSAFEPKEEPEPKMSVFRSAKSLDESAGRKQEMTQGMVDISAIQSHVQKTFPFPPNSEISDDSGTINLPVMSRVMRGPQQLRATFTHQEISSLGPNHPSANRIRTAPMMAQSPAEPIRAPPMMAQSSSIRLAPMVPQSSDEPIRGTPMMQQSSPFLSQTASEPQQKFPARSVNFPPLVKSRSGDILSSGFPATKKTASIPPTLQTVSDNSPPSPNIPRQKSWTEIPPLIFSSRESKPLQNAQSVTNVSPLPQPTSFTNIHHSPNVSTSNPSLHTTFPKAPFLPNQSTNQDTLKRTSSGSSIFDRAKSLYISSRDAQGIPPGKTSAQNQQRRPKPPSLPKTSALFPKQYEAQMSPESADMKKREVESYFKFQQESQHGMDQPVQATSSSIPARYAKAKRKEAGGANDHRIRKSASQGQILNRQRSFSDGEDEDENVDQIFQSLFKASVESKMAKSSVSGNRSVSEQAEMKATKSATQSKAVEKSASVEASKTPTGTTIVKKQSSVSKTSSSYASSTTTAHVSTEKVTSGPTPAIEGSKVPSKSTATNSNGNKIFEYTNPAVKSSAGSLKDGLLAWCQGRTRAYKNVNITNFSSSWSDGLAFCALLHHFFPTAFDYDSLSPLTPKKNFDLAFGLADKLAGIYPLLETEDMLIMGKNPDYKCIFTYVNAMYLKLKDL